MSGARRTLDDSEARWEAVSLLDDIVNHAIANGSVSARGDENGWTEADMIAVERHMGDRVAGLLRRPRRALGGSS